MAISQYDAVLVDMEGTGFTGYYKKGTNLKLSDGITVINVWKPGKCPYYNGEVYKDAMIQFSGNAKNNFTYQDMQRINSVIELAIDYLNKEYEVIMTFLNKSNNKNYIIFTDNTVDSYGKIRLFGAIYDLDSSNLFAGNLSSQEEWNAMYQLMNSIFMIK